MREICLDTETTGFAVKEGDRIIEIGCVELSDHGITNRNFHTYLNPERKMEADVIEVHKITNEMLVDKPKFEDKADEFIDFVKGARLIIHNAAFDEGFLDAELEKIGKPKLRDLGCEIVDSLEIARSVYPQMHNNLDALCKRLNIDTSQREREGHGALLDAELLAQVYLVLKQQQTSFDMDAASVASVARHESVSVGELPVIRASEEDLSEHERVLEMVRKSAKGPALYDIDETEFAQKRAEEQKELDEKAAKMMSLLEKL